MNLVSISFTILSNFFTHFLAFPFLERALIQRNVVSNPNFGVSAKVRLYSCDSYKTLYFLVDWLILNSFFFSYDVEDTMLTGSRKKRQSMGITKSNVKGEVEKMTMVEEV